MKTLWIASLIGVVGTVAVGGSGASTRPSIATGGVPMANFTSNCGFSHSSNDDPIMHPGMPGMSHNHSFFGNVSTNACQLAPCRNELPPTRRPRRLLGADSGQSAREARSAAERVRVLHPGDAQARSRIPGRAAHDRRQHACHQAAASHRLELRPGERPSAVAQRSDLSLARRYRPPAHGDLPGLLERT